MKSTEAAMLCRYVAACCPQQKFDEYTPDAWFDLLGDLPFDLCKIAAAEIAKKQPFVAPSEIRGALGRMRRSVREALDARTPIGERLAIDFDPDEDPREIHARRRREAEARDRHIDELIRRGGANFLDVDLMHDAPDAPWSVPRAELVESVVSGMPALTV